jgi:hypothetical protein
VRRFLLLFFLAAFPLRAQYMQGGAINVAPDVHWWEYSNTYSFTFTKSLVAPCTIMISNRYPTADPNNPGSITDTQGNSFSPVAGNPGGYDQLWTSNTCSSGPDTVTFSYAKAGWAQFTVSEYTGTWIVDQVSPEVVNVDSYWGWTDPVMPSQDGELIIGIGNNHTSNTVGIIGNLGFTVRAYGNQFIGDFLQTKAAPVFSVVQYSDDVVWCQRTISFRRSL